MLDAALTIALLVIGVAFVATSCSGNVHRRDRTLFRWVGTAFVAMAICASFALPAFAQKARPQLNAHLGEKL